MRFVREYAADKKKRIHKNENLRDDEKSQKMYRIDVVVRMFGMGMIPIDEVMKEIANA